MAKQRRSPLKTLFLAFHAHIKDLEANKSQAPTAKTRAYWHRELVAVRKAYELVIKMRK